MKGSDTLGYFLLFKDSVSGAISDNYSGKVADKLSSCEGCDFAAVTQLPLQL